jgi:hypothetical protein
MNNNSEKEYWQRAVREVLEASGETLESFAERMGVSVRQVHNWKHGERPTGLVAVRFFEYRRILLTGGIVLHCSPSGASIVS